MIPSDLTSAYIGGRWIRGAASFSVINPATGAVVGEVADLTPDDVLGAIDAAAAALSAWSARTAYDRAAILHRWGALILAHQEDLARLMTAEQGKPLGEARGEVAFGVSFLDWFAEEAKRAYGDVIPPVMASKRYLTLRQAAYRFGVWRSDFVGSPKTVADEIERWFVGRAADGFNLRVTRPADFALFREKVVPILQDRGLFRTEYSHDTLRGHLGLPVPENRWTQSARGLAAAD